MPTATEVILRIARHELRAAIRGRMVPALAALFCILALGITAAGLAGSGQLLVQGFTRTAASLLSLSVYLLPLIGALVGASAMGSGDGGMELLLAQPIERTEALLGRLAGLGAAVLAVAAAGFVPAALVILVGAGAAGLAGYAITALAATALGMVGLGIGTLIGVLTRRRGAAVGIALALWIGAALLYDLACILVLQLAGDGQPGTALVFLLGLNPVDGVRAIGLIALGADVLLGPAGAALQRSMHGGGSAWILASLTGWVVLPTAAAAMVYRRRDV